MNAPSAALADAIDAVLPQTQCRQCGYAGCRPYAEAVANGTAGIDQCAPGGDEGVREIAALLGVRPVPVNPKYGVASPPAVAVIDEERCIGCTLCIRACPVDAIVGAGKLMHTVITSHCTGCELCIPPCPVDCIAMSVVAPRNAAQRRCDIADNRRRYDMRQQRLQRLHAEKMALASERRDRTAEYKKRAIIQKALERARLRLQNRPS